MHASIHNECRSKKLNTVLNHRLRKSSSYDELETIDFTLTNRLLKGLREHCVLISNFVDKNVLLGGMDNADCTEDTKSGTGSSHDTILLVLQNQKEKNDTVVFTHDKDDSENKRSIDTIL